MHSPKSIYILGAGAIGFPLAAYLAHAGRHVVAVRTSRKDVPQSTVTVTVRDHENGITIPVETVSLSRLTHLNGMIVVTAKSYANPAIAQELRDQAAAGPIVILQNGLGVEKPFMDAQFPEIYRCILYATGQTESGNTFTFRPITSSPIGAVRGSESGLQQCVQALTTARFPFRAETHIQSEIWKKAIINTVFNSICPLLDVDNGIFARDERAAALAGAVVKECVALTNRLNLGLNESDLMAQIQQISQGSDGQLISTLQDIKAGRQTEIEFLNLEMARMAASMQPRLALPKVAFLGEMILTKSLQKPRSPQ